jgi:photosystem II stability/assembly factor-like uncharacterized protein
MKTPIGSTRTRLVKQKTATGAAVQPWGTQPLRVLVETVSRGAPPSAARVRLKERAAQDHPQGKALARLQYFELQRGLAAPMRAKSRGAARPATRQVRKRVRVNAAAAQAPIAPAFKAAAQLPVWRELGPTLVPHGQTYGSGPGSTPAVAGRCSGVIVDRNDSTHLVLCSAGGGLWGSHDGGATWAPLTDSQPTLVMGAIVQSRSAPHVVYAATGDGDGQLPYGVGLLRSSDGGQTWTHAPSAALVGEAVYDLAVEPGDALRVWIAALSGLYFSRDGGATVQRVLGEQCWSLSLPATNAQEIFAACASGLLRSGDGGGTWTRAALPGSGSASSFERLEVCHAPSQPGIVYVAGCLAGGNRPLLWRRGAAGAAFAAEASPGSMQITQAWYDWCLQVAPDDANLVYWGAIDLYRGRRGTAGMAWSNISSRKNGDSIHPDQHFVTFDSANPRIVYACNDGGLFRSPDGGDHWQSLNPGLGITEFEYLAQLESDPAWLLGGTQDNGTLTNAGLRRWDQVALGDGGDCAAVDRGAASICYHSYYDMPIERAAALGAQAFTWTDVSPPTPNGYQALFYPPLEAGGSVLVKAGATVWVSADEGNAWEEVALPTSHNARPDLATALAIVGEKTLLVGTVAGRVYRIVRSASGWAGATVTTLTPPGNGYVSDIAVVGKTARTLWLSCSHGGGGHLFRSLDGGVTWADRSTKLPDVAVSALVVDPRNSRTVYVATDQGVYRTTNSGGAWNRFSNGLPNAIVGDLVLHAGSRVLRAGTRSRGAWEVSLG